MLRRLLRSWRNRLGSNTDKPVDPELLLTQAQEEMTRLYVKQRERVIQAVTAKNTLRDVIAAFERQQEKREREVAEADEQGRAVLAAQIRDEWREAEAELMEKRRELVVAEETAEVVERAMRFEESKIRQKTVEAIALKAQLRNNEIQRAMYRALEGIQGMEEIDSAYHRAAEMIKNSAAQKKAHAEMGSGNGQGSVDGIVPDGYYSPAEQEREVRAIRNRLIILSLLIVILVLIVLLIAR